MNRTLDQATFRVGRWIAGGIFALLALALFSTLGIGASPSSAAPGPPPAVPQATPGQDFQDVVPSNAFYPYLYNLYQAGVVSGYACQPGGPNDPCVPPDNL